MIVSLKEAKLYLKVDSNDEDAYIRNLINTAESMCCDIARTDNKALGRYRSLAKTATLYAVAYLYEHREQADHKDLMETLKNLLFQLREEVF